MTAPFAKATLGVVVEKTDEELTPEQLREKYRTEIQASLTDARIAAAYMILQPHRGTGYFTPAARRQADDAARRERDSRSPVDPTRGGIRDKDDRFVSPEANRAGLNTGNVASPGNLKVISAEAQLHTAVLEGVRQLVRFLARRRGVCALVTLPRDADLTEHSVHLLALMAFVDEQPDALELLGRIAADLAAAVRGAGEVAYGESMTSLEGEPCIHCGRNTLVMFWARPHNDLDVDTARCDRDPRTGHYETCTCAAPLCECKRRPRSYRHEWRRVTGTGPHTIHFLNNRLAQIRGLKKEGSPAMPDLSDAPPVERPLDGHEHYLTAYTEPGSKVTAKIVDAAELYRIWMRPDATGMTDDHQAGFRIVHLADGRAFATELEEISSAGGAADQDLVHTHLVPGIRPEGECPACDQTRRDVAAATTSNPTDQEPTP